MALSGRSLVFVGVLVLVAFAVVGLGQAVAGPASAPAEGVQAQVFPGKPSLQSQGFYINEGNAVEQKSFDVPDDGKILVIDFVSAEFASNAGEQVQIRIMVNKNANSDDPDLILFSIPTHEIVVGTSGQTTVLASQMVRIYVESEDDLIVQVSRSFGVGTVGGGVTLSGYTVDKS